MTSFQVFVPGKPKGQPRPRAFARGGKARVYDPSTAEGWKSAIAVAVRDYIPAAPSDDAFEVRLDFWFARPKSHYGTGKNADELKQSAPDWHTSKPDLDNLAKAVLDCLTTLGLWKDDAQVMDLRLSRMWCEDDEEEGMEILVREHR